MPPAETRATELMSVMRVIIIIANIKDRITGYMRSDDTNASRDCVLGVVNQCQKRDWLNHCTRRLRCYSGFTAANRSTPSTLKHTNASYLCFCCFSSAGGSINQTSMNWTKHLLEQSTTWTAGSPRSKIPIGVNAKVQSNNLAVFRDFQNKTQIIN